VAVAKNCVHCTTGAEEGEAEGYRSSSWLPRWDRKLVMRAATMDWVVAGSWSTSLRMTHMPAEAACDTVLGLAASKVTQGALQSTARALMVPTRP
jgi:hypothetical protein